MMIRMLLGAGIAHAGCVCGSSKTTSGSKPKTGQQAGQQNASQTDTTLSRSQRKKEPISVGSAAPRRSISIPKDADTLLLGLRKELKLGSCSPVIDIVESDLRFSGRNKTVARPYVPRDLMVPGGPGKVKAKRQGNAKPSVAQQDRGTVLGKRDRNRALVQSRMSRHGLHAVEEESAGKLAEALGPGAKLGRGGGVIDAVTFDAARTREERFNDKRHLWGSANPGRSVEGKSSNVAVKSSIAGNVLRDQESTEKSAVAKVPELQLVGIGEPKLGRPERSAVTSPMVQRALKLADRIDPKLTRWDSGSNSQIILKSSLLNWPDSKIEDALQVVSSARKYSDGFEKEEREHHYPAGYGGLKRLSESVKRDTSEILKKMKDEARKKIRDSSASLDMLIAQNDDETLDALAILFPGQNSILRRDIELKDSK